MSAEGSRENASQLIVVYRQICLSLCHNRISYQISAPKRKYYICVFLFFHFGANGVRVGVCPLKWKGAALVGLDGVDAAARPATAAMEAVQHRSDFFDDSCRDAGDDSARRRGGR